MPPAFALALFDAAKEPKRLIMTPGGHSEAGFAYSSAQADQLKEFVQDPIR